MYYNMQRSVTFCTFRYKLHIIFLLLINLFTLIRYPGVHENCSGVPFDTSSRIYAGCWRIWFDHTIISQIWFWCSSQTRTVEYSFFPILSRRETKDRIRFKVPTCFEKSRDGRSGCLNLFPWPILFHEEKMETWFPLINCFICKIH